MTRVCWERENNEKSNGLGFLLSAVDCQHEHRRNLLFFSDDPNEEEHYLGYLPQYDKPYWVGYCDIDGGCDFDTAEELVQAKIFNGKSLKERWNRVVICSIEGLSYEDWLEDFEHEPVNPQSDEIIE